MTLDATRSTLAKEKNKLQNIEEEAVVTQIANNKHKEEMNDLAEQLKRLESVKIANQKLLQQIKSQKDRIENLDCSLNRKEKVLLMTYRKGSYIY